MSAEVWFKIILTEISKFNYYTNYAFFIQYNFCVQKESLIGKKQCIKTQSLLFYNKN